jgi:hypothetical protein
MDIEMGPIPQESSFMEKTYFDSLTHLAGEINNQFGGIISDEMPIKVIVEEVADVGGRRKAIKLVQEYWQGIELTHYQSGKVRTFFRNLFSHAPDIDTFGKLRKACNEQGEIAKISGLGPGAELFFADAFRKLQSS